MKMVILCYVLAVVGFIFAIWSLFNVFEPVEPTNLAPIGFMIGFVGPSVFGVTTIQLGNLFKDLEETKRRWEING